MVKYCIIANFIDLGLVLVTIFVFGTQDKTLIIIVSLVMVAACSAWIIFSLLFIIIPGICDKDDYILGALQLYLEIARMFYYMMRLLGEKK